MFSKKVLRIGLMVVALMSYSIAALAEDKKEEKIFTSSLQTPPPGYVLEKSFGSFVVIKEDDGHFDSKDILKLIAEATKEAEEIVKKLSGNAVLAQRINTQGAGRDGTHIFVIMQGEAALLKPAP
ncbi:MAG: hypothetical protein HY265_08360 [Deltaproteobacteria bacterium]|nr:hypothetical protein [Deltaproteobacteria bacterium]